MKKNLFTSAAVLSLALMSQAVFANSDKLMSKEDLDAIQQEYLVEYTEQAQPRRSALFAHILDTLTQNSTMAEADTHSAPLEQPSGLTNTIGHSVIL
ncbi:MAG: hypothetical protein CSB47_08215 [Proteobacteria bacterium]|nr:MAG: hypothetical protein CSB47_08215 [Pseudomonadota bacterium]